MLAFRSALASAIPPLSVLWFLAFSIYGMYLEERLSRYRGVGQHIARENRWNPGLYPVEAAKWLARDQRWHQLRIPVWLGTLVVSNVLYFLVKP
ncbi:MAG: hypothetical protein JWN79_3305 [Gemmatimonadetes bacterium]|nr:hypothetical protein [Gemmatimonadota bacterium]